MKQFSLLAMQADKEHIYDELIRSRVVHVKRTADITSCTTLDSSLQREQLLEKIARVEQAISYVTEKAELYNSEHKKSPVTVPKGTFAKPMFELAFDDFLAFDKSVPQVENDLDGLDGLKEKLSELQSDKAKCTAELDKNRDFYKLPHPTTWYHDTENAIVRLCQLPTAELNGLKTLAENYDTVTLDVVDENVNFAIVVAVLHKCQQEFIDKAVSYGLNKCSYTCEVLPRCVCEDYERQLNGINSEISVVEKDIVNLASKLTEWKIYVDYLLLCEKKLQVDGDLQNTASTFVLEGFYPAEDEQKVKDAIANMGNCTVSYFSDIGEDEFAPTLTRNNEVVKPFECVTYNYTPPDYHEIDPTPMMSVFYFLIFGFMVADMGYGLLLLIVGLFARFAIKQNTGTKMLLEMFGICGLSAILVGALYGGFFAITIFPPLIPDPSKEPMITMFLSLILGIVHIMAGIVCNMLVKYKHGQKLSAWLTDFPWIIVFVSFVFAVFNAMLDMAGYEPYEVLRLSDTASSIALYVCLSSLAFAIVCAGLRQNGIINKAIKSFSSAYGIINYFSDIMSYIRVFGLMLSSALMGAVINDLGAMVAQGGGIGYVFAGVVLVFAHLFNLVMGLLSVYIHNGRLQYVEFFGKFYTGDGVVYSPLGSETKYTHLN